MQMPAIQQIKTFNRFLNQSKARVNVAYGGAGSGKSVSVAQHLLKKFLQEQDKRILITRKTLPSLRITAWYEINRMLREWGIPVDINRSELIVRFGDNEILAKSLDDPEKIKSAEFNYIWIEEATELTKEDFQQLDLRLRRVSKDGHQNQMFLTFNPIDQFHWAITDLVQGNRQDVAIHHSTYKDNKFLPKEYGERLEQFASQDENFYRIYTLGEPGVLKNIIYTNYIVDPAFPPAVKLAANAFYGLDFGFNNPSALVEVSLKDAVPYVTEKFYQSNLTNADIIQRLKSLSISASTPIYCDAAEPQRIEEIRRAGFNARPADKSVINGIDHVKRYRLHINPESVNLIGEIRAYSYREDKDKRVLEEPVKFRDHCMDAMRYAIHTHLKQHAAPTIIGVKRNW